MDIRTCPGKISYVKSDAEWFCNIWEYGCNERELARIKGHVATAHGREKAEKGYKWKIPDDVREDNTQMEQKRKRE